MKLYPRVLVSVLLLLAGQPIRSSVFSDIASKFQSKENALGAGIGRAVGIKLGDTLETATAPALDNAASKFTEVVKTAGDTLDQSLKNENESIDAIAKRNVDRIDELTQTRLDQVDQLADARLKQIQKGASTLLDQEAAIIDGALKQENAFASSALDRIEAISGQSLSRLQELEGDAFDRVDSALQDQIPVAASQVAHEFVVAAVVVLSIVALFAFAGVSLWKNLQQARSSGGSMSEILKTGLLNFWKTLPREAAVVVLPTLLVAAVILGGYEGYLRSTRAMRVSRLEKAAGLLEASGEYTVAAQLRKRVMDVDGDSDSARKQFTYQADTWLADLTQKPRVNANDLLKRLALLQGTGLISENPDLLAASIYLRAEVYGDVDGAAASQFREKFLDGKSAKQPPFLGKLVLMTQIKAELDRAAPASERVAKALKLTDPLRASYPNYANGHVLAALLLGMLADGLENDAKQEAALRAEMSKEIARASVLDPDLARIVRLNHAALPADVLKDMDEKPRDTGLAARLGSYAATNIDPLARAILVSDVLTHQAVDRAILRAARRGLGERRVLRSIALLPGQNSDPEKRAGLMVSIAQQYAAIDSYLPAERWAQSAQASLAQAKTADPSLNKAISSLYETLTQTKISKDMAAVI